MMQQKRCEMDCKVSADRIGRSWAIRGGSLTHRVCAAALVISLSACSSIPKQVDIPVVQSCVKTIPTKPDKTANKDMSDGDLVLAIRADEINIEDWANQLYALLAGCQ